MGHKLQRVAEVLVFGHHGYLVAVHTDHLTLEVDQLPLTHLHHVPWDQAVIYLPLLPLWHHCKKQKAIYTWQTLLFNLSLLTENACFPWIMCPLCLFPIILLWTNKCNLHSTSAPSGVSSNFSSSARVGFTPSAICQENIFYTNFIIFQVIFLIKKKKQVMPV